MLFVVFLLPDHNVPVHQDVVEEEKLAGFCPLAAHLRENTLTHEDTSQDGQGLSGTSEATLYHGYSPGICLTVHCEKDSEARKNTLIQLLFFFFPGAETFSLFSRVSATMHFSRGIVCNILSDKLQKLQSFWEISGKVVSLEPFRMRISSHSRDCQSISQSRG